MGSTGSTSSTTNTGATTTQVMVTDRCPHTTRASSCMASAVVVGGVHCTGGAEPGWRCRKAALNNITAAPTAPPTQPATAAAPRVDHPGGLPQPPDRLVQVPSVAARVSFGSRTAGAGPSSPPGPPRRPPTRPPRTPSRPGRTWTPARRSWTRRSPPTNSPSRSCRPPTSTPRWPAPRRRTWTPRRRPGRPSRPRSATGPDWPATPRRWTTGPSSPPGPPQHAPSVQAGIAVEAALSRQGLPYVWARRGSGQLRLLQPDAVGVAAGRRRDPAEQRRAGRRCPRSRWTSCSPATWSPTTRRSPTSACTSATARCCTPRCRACRSRWSPLAAAGPNPTGHAVNR